MIKHNYPAVVGDPAPVPEKKVCIKCKEEFTQTHRLQKKCPACREMAPPATVPSAPPLIPMSLQECTDMSPIVNAAVALVKLCMERGIQHAVKINIYGISVTIEQEA